MLLTRCIVHYTGADVIDDVADCQSETTNTVTSAVSHAQPYNQLLTTTPDQPLHGFRERKITHYALAISLLQVHNSHYTYVAPVEHKHADSRFESITLDSSRKKIVFFRFTNNCRVVVLSHLL